MKKHLWLFIILVFGLNNILHSQNYAYSFRKETDVPPGKAVFYIYRYNFENDPYHFTVNANQKPVTDAHLYSKGYLVYFGDPGRTEFWAQSGKKKYNIVIDAEAGKSYYIKTNLKRDMVLPFPHILFILTPEERALKEIIKRKRII